MIEQGTELEANATWSTEVKIRSLKIDIDSSSSTTFKNGLPYYGTLKIEEVEGGQSANGTQVKICTKLMRQRRRSIEVCNSYAADASGYVHYHFFPNNPDVVYYSIKVIKLVLFNYNVKHLASDSIYQQQATVPKVIRSKRESPVIELSENGEEKILAENSFSIQSSYSPSESYLSFVPHRNYPNSLPCNSKLPIKLYYTANNITKDQFNLHFMVPQFQFLINYRNDFEK